MKRKYQGYSTNFMEYRSQNFNQLSIILNGITKDITMHAVLHIDRLFQHNNKKWNNRSSLHEYERNNTPYLRKKLDTGVER